MDVLQTGRIHITLMNRLVNTPLYYATRILARVDFLALRLSVIFIFALFGTYKWFAFEANALEHLLTGTWLGCLYPYLGSRGVSYVLGVVENITLLGLIIGIFRPAPGAAGAVMVIGTGVVTLSLQPQLGRIDSFIIKDVLLIGAGITLLRHDLRRVLIQRRNNTRLPDQTGSSATK
jgi:Predicted membrane protein